MNIDVLRKTPLSSESPTCKEASVAEIEGKDKLIEANENQANIGEHKDNEFPINNKRKSVNNAHGVKSEGLLTKEEILDENEESAPIITEEGIQSKVGILDPVESIIAEDKNKQIADKYPTKASHVTDKIENSLRKEMESGGQ